MFPSHSPSRSRLKLLSSASFVALALSGSASAQVVTSISAAAESNTKLAPTIGMPTVRPDAVGGGNDYVVTSNNVSGATAFNHFNTLNLATHDLATLVLPGTTNALINLVDNKMQIDGTITTRLGTATGAVGGTVYFLTQSGLLMGSTARINTGTLIVRGGGPMHISGDGIGTPLTTVSDLLGADGALVTGAASLAFGAKGADTVTLGGVIAAPGGLDVKATTVNILAGSRILTGAAALADLQATKDDGGVNALVSVDGLVAGTHLVAGADGAIRIAADGDVTMADASGLTAAPVLDARPVGYADGSTTRRTTGGVALTSGGKMTIRGTVTAWDGVHADAAGDVTIATHDVQTDGGSLDYARISANSTLDVAATIAGGAVSLTAHAHASSDVEQTDPLKEIATTAVNLGAKVLALIGGSIDAYASIVASASSIGIGPGSVVTAKGDLSIAATTLATGKAIARVKQDSQTANFALAGAYSGLNSNARVTIDSASLTAGGALSLTATNETESDVSVKAFSLGKAVVGAVAINEVTIAAGVNVLTGSALTGGSVKVLAKNFQNANSTGFNTLANAVSIDGSAGGAAASVSEQDIKATIAVAGSVTAQDVASFTAYSDTARNINSATATADSSTVAQLATLPANTNEAKADLIGKIAAPLVTLIGDKIRGGPSETPDKKDATTNFAAGLAVTESAQVATTNVTANVTAGSVTLDGKVTDALARNIAGSSIVAKPGAGVTTAVGGAVAYDNTSYDAEAKQSGNVTAGSLAVTSTVDRPIGGDWLSDIKGDDSDLDPLKYLGSFKDKISGTLNITSGLFASAAGATASTGADDSTAISGSVNYNALTSKSLAGIGDNAHIVLGGPLTVRAITDIVALNIGGAIPAVTAIIARDSGTSSPGKAFGGAVAVFAADPTTVASIGNGVQLTRAGQPGVDATVEAKASVKAVTLAPLSGSSGNGGFSGTFAVNLLHGDTHATVGAGGSLDLGTGSFSLNAHTGLDIWGVAGSIAVPKGTTESTVGSVGISGVFNQTEFTTTAEFTPKTGAPKSVVTAGAIGIDAVTTGGVNALSVAGTATSTSGREEKPEESSNGVKVKTYVGILTSFASTKLGEIIAKAAAAQDAEEKAKKLKDAAAGSAAPATKSFGVAGSASVDLATLTTRIDVANASFARSGGLGTIHAVAAEGVDMLSLTGGAVLTYGPKPSSGAAQIAGAYGLVSSSNTTAVNFGNSTIADFGAVNLEADANGLRIAAGLSLGVDTTGADKGFGFAASVSQIEDADSASTTFDGGAITRTGTTKTGAVTLLAYDSETLGAGAGGLVIGKTTAFGGAATVIDASPSDRAATAKLTNASVTGFDGLSVRGLNASLVASAAIAGAVSAGNSSAGGVAINVNIVNLDTVALVDLGTSGTNHIDIGGALTIASGDVKEVEAVTTTGAGRTAGTAGASVKGDYGLPTDQFAAVPGTPEVKADNTTTPPVAAKPAVPAVPDANVGAPTNLNIGSQIYALALPIAVSKGGNAGGIAFSWNSTDNDRSAMLSGSGLGSGSAVTAGSIAVGAVDLSKIVTVAAGVGVTKDGNSAIGSFTRNSITGTTSASVATDSGATSHLQIKTGTLAVGATADGGIWSLAGAIGASKNAAAGFALGINEILRDDAAPLASTPGLLATLDNVTLLDAPDIVLHADSTGTIESTAVAGAGGKNVLVGAASVNTLKPDVTAKASGLNYLEASSGDLKVSASDTSTITSRALMLGVGEGNAFAAGVAVNDVAAHIAASLTADAVSHIDERNLLITAASTATTTTLGAGISGGGNFALAGSVAVNTTDTTADALLTLSGGTVNAAGSVGVIATRDSTIDAFSGNIAVSTGSGALGASVVVNDIGGGASAKIVGTAGSGMALTASADGVLDPARQLKSIRTGATTATQAAKAGTLSSIGDLKNVQNTAPTLGLDIADKQGVVVSAVSTHGTRTFAVTGAAADGAAIAATAVVTQAAGTTTAAIENTNVAVGNSLSGFETNGLSLDVLAGTHIAGVSFAGAIAGAGNFAGAAPIVSDGYSATTDAHTTGGSLTSVGDIAVRAASSQAATALVIAGAIGGTAAASVSTVSPRFAATTTALIDRPTALVAIGSGGVNIGATSQATTTAVFGAISASGTVAVAGGIVVATNENTTTANYFGLTDATTKLGSVVVTSPVFAVTADGGYDATVLGGGIAVSGTAAGAANVVGVIHRGTVAASADALDYGVDDLLGNYGAVTIAASENVKVGSKIAAAAIAVEPLTSAAVTIGAQFILAQGKVDAQLNRPTVAADSVTVKATGTDFVDVLQAGLAASLGFGGGANVTYVGVGKVASGDTAVLRASSTGSDSDSQTSVLAGSTGSGNVNTAALTSGDLSATKKSTKAQSVLASTGVVAADDGRRIATGAAGTTAADGSAIASSTTGFGQIADVSDAADSRARARITAINGSNSVSGSVVAANAVAITSDAELQSKSTNIQGSAGVVAASATVGITRNAANSFASLGDGVVVSGRAAAGDATKGSTLNVTANTGQQGGHAAEVDTYQGTAGLLAVSAAVADARLDSVTKAESSGQIDAFTTVKVAATDTSDVVVKAIGVSVAAANINVVVATADKHSMVAAGLSGSTADTQVLAKTVDVAATAGGMTNAHTIAGAGGTFYSGNAAVATATDERTVLAQVAENTRLSTNALTVSATATPDVAATAYGLTVSDEIAVGATVATATSAGTITATIGEGSDLRTGQYCTKTICAPTVMVLASVAKPSGGTNVTADTKAAAGGSLAAINGSVSTARLEATTTASLGADLDKTAGTALTFDVGTILTTDASNNPVIVLLPGAAVTVAATRDLAQTSLSSGLTLAGGLAVGVQYASADSLGDTSARLLNVDAHADTMGGNRLGAVTIKSTSFDANTATTRAGAGGLGVGVASVAKTSAHGTAATVVAGAAGKTFAADSLTATAESRAGYATNSDSLFATIVGGSGTTSTDTVDTAATVTLGRATPGAAAGSNTRFEAGTFTVLANNKVNNASATAKGKGGGVLTGSAALVTTDITQHATTTINDGVTLRQYGGDLADNGRQTFVDATVETTANGSVQLEIGGVMQFPFARLNATYTPTAAVNIGNNVLLRGDQGIGVGTTITEGTADTAKAQIYGLAGIGGASSNATTNSTGIVTVGDGSTIESLADIRLSAGTSSRGTGSDSLATATQTDTFNWTLLPLSTDASANSNVHGSNTLTLGAATIRSGRDVIVTALAPRLGASASGTGHNPYLALFSQSSDGGHIDQGGSGSIAFNNTKLTAGYLNTRTIDISGSTPGAFTVDIHDTDTNPDRLGKFTVKQSNLDILANIDAQIAAFGSDPLHADDVAQLKETKAAIVTGLNGAAANTNGVKVDGVFAGGGEVIVGAGAVKSTGSTLIAANGAPTITITNTSANNLILGRLFEPFKPSGVISFTGPVDLAALKNAVGAANVVTSGVDATAEGTIKAVSGQAFDTVLTDVITDGVIDNTGGVYKVVVNNGNYVQLNTVSAAVYSVNVPNGLFSVATPLLTFDAGNPISYFYGHQGISLFGLSSSATNVNGSINPTDAADYIATYLSNKSDPSLNYKHLTDQGDRALQAFAPGATFHAGYPPYRDANGHRLDINGNARSADGFGLESLTGSDSVIWGSCRESTCQIAAINSFSLFGNNIVFSLPFSSSVPFGVDYGSAKNTYGATFATPYIAWKDTVPNTPTVNSLPANYKGTVAASTTNQLDATTTPAVAANQILIDAKYVNISADLVAGPNKTRSVTVDTTANIVLGTGVPDGTIGFDALLAGVAPDTNGDIILNKAYATLGEGVLPATAQLATGDIAARFHRGTSGASSYISIDPVSAGAGGYISITGQVVNTNPLAGDKGSHLIVKNGFADISIVNNTKYDVRLSTLNAGSSADGIIKIVDKAYNKDPAGGGSGTQFDTRTTLYRDTLGRPVTVDITDHIYNAVNGNYTDNTQPTNTLFAGAGIAGGSSLSYSSLGQSLYYVYSESRNIHRNVQDNYYGNVQNVPSDFMDAWSWVDGGSRPQASDPTSGFVDINSLENTGALQVAASQLIAAINSDNKNFVQIVTGGLRTDLPPVGKVAATGYTIRAYRNDDSYQYHNQNNPPYYAPHFFLIPTDATVKVLTAVRANNPFGIVFQGSNGGITVASNGGGKIVLNGQLTDAGGKVSLSTNSAIVQNTTGNVLARDLVLSSAASIGNGATDPFRAAIVGRTSGTDGVGGTVSATSTNGDVSLRLTPTSGSGGALDSVKLDLVSAKGAVNIVSDGGIAAVDHAGAANDANVIAQSVVLTAAGGVQGDPSFAGATALNRRGLSVDIRDAGSPTGTGTLTVTAGGDIDIRTATHDDGVADIGSTLRLGNITTTGDVILRAAGSVVAADATATIDQAKLDRFVTAAKDLGLCSDTVCASSKTDAPAARAAIDTDLRATGAVAFDAYTIFTSLKVQPQTLASLTADAAGKTSAANAFKAASPSPLVTIGNDGKVAVGALLLTTNPLYKAALDTLKNAPDLVAALAPYSPAYSALKDVKSEVISTATVGDLQRGLQLYYDSLRLPLASQTVVLSKAELAAKQAAADAFKVSASATRPSLTVANDGNVLVESQLSMTDPLYTTALDTLRSAPAIVAALAPYSSTYAARSDVKSEVITTPTVGDLQRGLQLYYDSLRLPLPTLQVQLGAAARANADAVGKLQATAAFTADAARSGVTIGGDGRVTLTTPLAPTDPLYTTALHALEGKRDLVRGLAAFSPTYAAQVSTVTAEIVPLPNVSDLQRGLQLYYDGLRLPLAALFTGSSAPTLGVAATPALQQAVDAANLKLVGGAVTANGYAAYGAAQVAGAQLTLTDLFGKVPTEQAFIKTATIVGFDRYLVGKTWAQTMLDFTVPSSAFVPVADTQFQTRKPVITARNVFITAGDSIGSFDAAQTFTFDKTGVDQNATASAADKAARTQLAAAYLASAGPGDLTTVLKNASGTVITDLTVVKDKNGVVTSDPKATIASVGFTTRRDQPLQLAATGTVNALAATRLLADAGYANTTATTETRAVRGDIFINNVGTLTIGDIISEKIVANPTTTHLVGTTVTNDCATGVALSSECDSRIRLVGESIVGVNGGAPVIGGRRQNAFFTSPNLSDAAGRAVIMGGLVRLEASSGSIGLAAPTAVSGTGILIDARALETVRAGGDISLVKRAPVAVGIFTGPHGILTPTTDTAYPADLIVGDVFAGGRFTLDNPVGALYVGALPSNLSSENRNARLVVQTLALRAYGDIGNTALTTAAKPGLFDITAPVIDVLLAGYDFAAGKLRTIASAPNDPTGSVSFGLRGNTLVGGSPTSRLGARRSITIGNIDDFPSKIDIETSIEVGEKVNITTAGGVTFGRAVNIGVLADGNQLPGVLDLSRLTLNLLGPLNLTETRSLIFGSLSANGGTVQSDGSITLKGILTGTGNDPFTLYGHQGVTVGGLAGGAVGLRSDLDVALTGPALVRDLTLQGRSVTTAGVTGTTVTLIAAPTGTVTIGGTTVLTRDATAPNTPANLTATGGNVALTGPVDVADAVVLTTTGTAPNGILTLGGPLKGGDVTLTAPKFVGGNSDITARGRLVLTTASDVALGRLTATSGSVTTTGALTTTGVSVTDGALALTASDVDLGASDSVKGALTVNAGNDIRLGKAVTVSNSATAGEALTLTAAHRVVAPAGAVIGGQTTAARLTIATGNVDFDPTVTVSGMNVSVQATGKATLGTILAGPTQTVAVTARGAVTTGAVTGKIVTLVSATDALNILGPITGGVVTLTADRAIVTNGLTATAATVTTNLGGINLNGATTIANAASPTTAKLIATAAQTISVNGRASATGGMTLTAATLLTGTTGGVLVDTGLFGAPFVLRADNVNVSFDTGALAGGDLHVDARARSGGLLALGEFRFAGVRGVTFDTLAAAKARIYANQLLTITSLSMTDYLWMNIGGQTLAVTGTGAGVPAAQRKVATGALKNVKVVVTPTRTAPTLVVNGVGR